MLVFLVIVSAMVVVVLAMLLKPLLHPQVSVTADSNLERRAVFRQQFEELEQDKLNAILDDAQYAQAKSELERRMLDEVGVAPVSIGKSLPDRRLALILLLLIPIAAAFIYLKIGSFSSVATPDVMAHLPTSSQQAAQQSALADDIEPLLQALRNKLKDHPQDGAGWALLGRSYLEIKRFDEAVKAYEKAEKLIPDDPQLLADYADVVATNANGNFSGKPIDLINMALKLDPHHAMSLWLAGSAAFNAEQYQLAIQYWSRLYQLMPADSDDGRSILASINEAREKQNLPILSEIKVAPKNMTLEKSMKNSAITGMVEIDPKLKAKRSNADILMVIARGPDSRMPVAVLRIPSPLLPYKFTLDDSNSMSPEFKISNLKEVNLEVRISKLGQAKLESGDLIGEISFVKVNQKNIKVLIDKVQP